MTEVIASRTPFAETELLKVLKCDAKLLLQDLGLVRLDRSGL